MKVTLSNYAWIPKEDLSESSLFLLKQRLTVIPKESEYNRSSDDVYEETKKILMYKETDTHVGVPRHFFRKNQNRSDTVVDYQVSNGQDLLPNVKAFALRKHDQAPVMETIYNSLTCNPWGTGLLEAYTGFGKTVCGIHLILKLGGNAIIIVPTNPILNQWKKAIKNFYPNARIGVVQQKKCDYKDKDIVLAMVQTLMKDSKEEQFPKEFFSYFRTLVVDEVHMLGGREFSKSVPRFNHRYGFGLSGTIRRFDNCEIVFKWHLGDVIVKAKDKYRIKPYVWIKDTGFTPIRKESLITKKNGNKELKVYDQNDFSKATQLNFIAKDLNRTRIIAKDVFDALRAGRNPLVMSERKKLLEDIANFVELLAKNEPGLRITHGFYIGDKSEEEKEAASRCSVIYATIQLAKLGLDIERLDTLFMATPLSDVEQLVGRVCRPKIMYENGEPVVVPKKHHAMIVDYVDYRLDRLYDSHNSRLRQYNKLKWKVMNPLRESL